MASTVHYDAWGQVVAQSGTQIPIGYQGDWTDPLLGTVRMGVRWYYPKVGRFLSSDPAAGTASPRTPMAGLRWLYGNNSPLRYRDPSGLDACIDDGVGNCVYPDSPPSQDAPPPTDPCAVDSDLCGLTSDQSPSTPSNPCYNDDTGLCGMDAATAADYVNRLRLNQTIDSLQFHLANRDYIRPGDMETVADIRAGQMEQELRWHEQLWGVINDPKAPAQTYLLGFDYAKRHLIIAYGDPGWAEHTAVFVPGSGSSLEDASAADLFREVQRQYAKRPSLSLSTIYWVGQDNATSNAFNILTLDRARNGAPALISFLSGLRASHLGAPSDLTVIGLSYSSTLVAEAARRSSAFAADNIVLVGSPGVPVESASQLHGAPGHVFVAANGGDVVVNGSDAAGSLLGRPRHGWLGADPTDPMFGARRFSTGGRYAGATGNLPFLDHTYFQPESRSLLNIAAIVAGQLGDIV